MTKEEIAELKRLQKYEFKLGDKAAYAGLTVDPAMEKLNEVNSFPDIEFRFESNFEKQISPKSGDVSDFARLYRQAKIKEQFGKDYDERCMQVRRNLVAKGAVGYRKGEIGYLEGVEVVGYTSPDLTDQLEKMTNRDFDPSPQPYYGDSVKLSKSEMDCYKKYYGDKGEGDKSKPTWSNPQYDYPLDPAGYQSKSRKQKDKLFELYEKSEIVDKSKDVDYLVEDDKRTLSSDEEPEIKPPAITDEDAAIYEKSVKLKWVDSKVLCLVYDLKNSQLALYRKEWKKGLQQKKKVNGRFAYNLTSINEWMVEGD